MSLTEQGEIDKAQEPETAAAGPAVDKGKRGEPEKTVTVEVDEIPVLTPKETTPRTLLIAAGKDPASRQLVRVKSKHQEPFTDPDQQIKVHEGEQFITTSTGNTPVS